MLQRNLNFGGPEEKAVRKPDIHEDTHISVEEIIDLIVGEERRVLSSNGQFVFEGI